MKKKATVISEFAQLVSRHYIFTHAAAISYSTALSLAPFIVIILSLSSLLSPDMQSRMLEEIFTFWGPSVAQVVNIVVDNVKETPSLSSFSGAAGLLALAISASFILTTLRAAFDHIYEFENSENERNSFFDGVKRKLLSVSLVFLVVIISVISLLGTAFLDFFFAGSKKIIWDSLLLITSLMTFTFLFTGLNYYIPSTKPSLRQAFKAGILTSVCFHFGKYLIGIYLKLAAVGSAYGVAGALIVFLVWVYYTAAIILLSTEAVLFQERKRKKQFFQSAKIKIS